MMPRFVMPDFMDTVALFTLNGWALDGFLKVFWYDDPAAGIARSLLALAPQLVVLSLLAVVFLEGRHQNAVVPGMQPDGGLVQDVADAPQVGAEL